MKANELMIGDWIFLKNGKVLQTCKVTVIGNATQNRNKIGKYVCLDTSDEFPTCIFEIDKISPIPLTAEILEKNGFYKEFDCDVIYYVHDNPLIKVEVGNNFRIYEDNRFYIKGIFAQKFYYVHELQHAMRIMGCDKEIKL